MAVDGEVVEEANGGERRCAHTPCCPKHPLWCWGGYGLTTSTQSAVIKNTGAYPERAEGILGIRCLGGGKLPATRSSGHR